MLICASRVKERVSPAAISGKVYRVFSPASTLTFFRVTALVLVTPTVKYTVSGS